MSRSIAEAAAAGALRLAESDYREAERLLRDGWIELGRQQGRLPPLRDFARADSFLAEAAIAADRAARQAGTTLAAFERQARNERSGLTEQLEAWRKELDTDLRRPEAEVQWRIARVDWVIAGRLLEDGHLEEALSRLARVDSTLGRLAEHLTVRRLEEEGAEAVQRWRSWVGRAVEASRSGGGPAVVVDKSAHRLFLLFAGEVVASFLCDLGYNPGTQKRSAGDGATPEGFYIVTAVRWNGSRYHRALLLDYPNESDRERYRALVRTGAVPSYARIGGNIEIHGAGGIGRDWTDGCMALADTDIERLMRNAREGMPVAIVRKAVGWP